MYLFDTDVLSNLIKKNPSKILIEKLGSVPAEVQFTSTITVGELIYGAYKSEKPDYFLKKLDELVWPNVIVVAFDEKAAHIYGNIRAEQEKVGISISEPDLRIASIVLANNLMLVTANLRHFSKINGLKIENWLD